MTAAPLARILLLHLSVPHLTSAAPTGLRVLHKRGPFGDGFYVLVVVGVVLGLLGICCFTTICNLQIAPCGCCRCCSDYDDDLNGRSSWLFKLSRGRYGAPPAPRPPSPPEFELQDVDSEPQQWGGALPVDLQSHSPHWQRDAEPRRHRRPRSHSEIFQEALDAERRPPAHPKAETVASDRLKENGDEAEAHRPRDEIDGWRKDVAAGSRGEY